MPPDKHFTKVGSNFEGRIDRERPSATDVSCLHSVSGATELDPR
jgi:hypothetical protein